MTGVQTCALPILAFKNVSNMPARVKCALLAWHTIEDMLNKNDENGKGTINCCH